MFGRIAGRYDLLNRTLSMGIDQRWRKRVLRAAGPLEGRLVVNLPAALERLSTALMAAPVAFDDLPETLRERWLTADGRARVQVIPAETMDSNEALSRFVDSVMAVSLPRRSLISAATA